MSIHADTRRQLANLARSAKARKTDFSPEAPIDWRPSEVRTPEGEFWPYFTNAAAWEFIADKLDEGHEVEVVPLRKPKGATGYVMKIALDSDARPLYVKLQLRSREVIGRSFHYSKRS